MRVLHAGTWTCDDDSVVMMNCSVRDMAKSCVSDQSELVIPELHMPARWEAELARGQAAQSILGVHSGDGISTPTKSASSLKTKVDIELGTASLRSPARPSSVSSSPGVSPALRPRAATEYARFSTPPCMLH